VAELVPVLIIVALLALNALFVAAEFAIVGVPRAAIERRAQQGSRVARIVRGVLADPRRQDRFIATAQLGITVASLGLGMYGEHVLADWIFHHVSTFAGTGSWAASHTLATILSIAFLTYLHIVLGEMIPKSLALQSAERTVLWITPVMRTINLAVYPLVVALNAVGNLMLRLVGINRAEGSSDHHYSPEELALIVDESEEGGQLRAEAGQMLRELFAFSDTSAREAATSTSRSWWRSSRPAAWSPAATRTRFRRCRTPRRSTTCWRRSAATPPRWRWSSTSTAAPPA
jgi:CBS domain containing-hemolysin-like protein